MAQIIQIPQVTIEPNGQGNWLITPAASPTGQTSPATWLVVLSGVAVADFTGVAGTEYTILIQPDVKMPVGTAVNAYGAPQPTGAIPELNIEQWAPSAAVGSIFDEDRGTDGGFDVRAWEPNAIPNPTPTEDVETGLSFNQIFHGLPCRHYSARQWPDHLPAALQLHAARADRVGVIHMIAYP